MFDKYRQLILGIVCALYGAVALYFGWLWAAVVLFVVSGACLYSFVAYGPVFVAFWHAKKKRFESASAILGSVKPKTAKSRKEAYYLLTSALIHINANELTTAERDLENVTSSLHLYEPDEALAYLSLATINHLQGKDKKALNYCRIASTYKANSSVSAKLKALEEELSRATEAPRQPAFLFRDYESPH